MRYNNLKAKIFLGNNKLNLPKKHTLSYFNRNKFANLFNLIKLPHMNNLKLMKVLLVIKQIHRLFLFFYSGRSPPLQT